MKDNLFFLKLALPKEAFDATAIDQHLREIPGGMMVSWVEKHDLRQKRSLTSICGKVTSWAIGVDHAMIWLKPWGPLAATLREAAEQGLEFVIDAKQITRPMPSGLRLVVGITDLTVRLK